MSKKQPQREPLPEKRKTLEIGSVSSAIDRGVPVLVGDCPSCRRGERSLIIVDFVPNYLREIDSTVYIRCVCCSELYQTRVKYIAEEG